MARRMRLIAAGVLGAVLLAACDPATSQVPSHGPGTTPPRAPDGAALAVAVVARLQADPFITHVEQIADAKTTETDDDGQAVDRPQVQITGSFDFSGDDMRAVMTASSAEATSRSEMAAIGGTFWTRVNDGDFSAMQRNAEVQVALDEIYSTFRITDDPGLLRYIGLETVDGQELHHLSAVPGTVSYTSGTFAALDLYVLEDGTPVLVQGAFTNEGPGVSVVGKTAIKYSSFGGPITIEAPTPSR